MGKFQRALLEECKQAEERYDQAEGASKSSGMPKSAQFVHTGLLSFKNMLEMLEHSAYVRLTKMQILVLVSEADTSTDHKVRRRHTHHIVTSPRGVPSSWHARTSHPPPYSPLFGPSFF